MTDRLQAEFQCPRCSGWLVYADGIGRLCSSCDYGHPKDTTARRNERRVIGAITVLGYEDTPAVRQQVGVVVEALDIFVQRTARHREIWRHAGWRGLLVDVRKKTERLWNEFMIGDSPPDDLDSALDAINYLVLFIRARRQGVDGDWKWK